MEKGSTAENQASWVHLFIQAARTIFSGTGPAG